MFARTLLKKSLKFPRFQSTKRNIENKLLTNAQFTKRNNLVAYNILTGTTIFISFFSYMAIYIPSQFSSITNISIMIDNIKLFIENYYW